MSRLYPGLYTVLVRFDGERYDITPPMRYEEAERMVVAFGFGVPYEGRRVVKALIVGPVAHTADIPISESHADAV